MSPPPTLTKIVATVGPASGDLQTIRRQGITREMQELAAAAGLLG